MRQKQKHKTKTETEETVVEVIEDTDKLIDNLGLDSMSDATVRTSSDSMYLINPEAEIAALVETVDGSTVGKMVEYDEAVDEGEEIDGYDPQTRQTGERRIASGD